MLDSSKLKQDRHETLVRYLNNYRPYSNTLRVYKKTRGTCNCEKVLTVNEINNAVVVFTDALNLMSGSACDLDLYVLMQVYLLDVKRRKIINEIIKG